MDTDVLSKLLLSQLLSDILVSQERLEAVARLSYKHQLGFEKYTLLNKVDGSCFRMHYWPKFECVRMEDVHSHCASFTSHVIFGALTHQVFTLAVGSEYIACSYHFDDLLGRSEMSVVQNTSLRLVSETRMSAGVTYFVGVDVLHKVIDVLPGTVTLSSWDARMADAIVVKEKSVVVHECVRYSGMKASSVRHRFAEIIGIIK